MTTRVGFVGIGTIGKPMALNIKKGGYELAVFDLNQQAVAELIEVGATGKASPAAVAEVSRAWRPISEPWTSSCTSPVVSANTRV